MLSFFEKRDNKFFKVLSMEHLSVVTPFVVLEARVEKKQAMDKHFILFYKFFIIGSRDDPADGSDIGDVLLPLPGKEVDEIVQEIEAMEPEVNLNF
jgi:hypothetical protein